MKNRIFLSVLGLALLLGSCIVEDESVRVESVSLDRETLNLAIGDKFPLKATVLPVDADNRSVLWESSNQDVVLVTSDGVVIAQNTGHAVVVAKAAGNKGVAAFCEVEVSSEIIPLDNINIEKETLEMYVMETDTLMYRVEPENTTENIYAWSSLNDSVAIVTADGVVIARNPGETTVYVSGAEGKVTDSCLVTVKPLLFPLQSICLSEDTLNLFLMNSDTLECFLDPEFTTEKVNWRSSNPETAIVNGGIVTALRAGSTTIYASSVTGTVIDSCIVNVSSKVYPLEAISLGKDNISLYPHESDTIVPVLTPANTTEYKLVWTSSTPEVAIVNHGIVTALVEGETIIYARGGSDGSIVASCAVSVIPHTNPLTELELSEDKLEMFELESHSLICKLTPENTTDNSIEWSSSDSAVAIVNNGVVTALRAGNAVISAKGADGRLVDNCSVVVKCKATGVILSKHEETIECGNPLSLKATVYPVRATEKKVIWTSSDKNVATVDSEGHVTVKSSGEAIITVTAADGGFTDNCVLTVVNPVSGLSIDKSSLTMYVNDEADLKAMVEPLDATNPQISWVSDNADVVTVDKAGRVKALKSGTAMIIAVTLDGGHIGTCKVTVYEPVSSVYLNLSDTVALYKDESVTPEPTVYPKEAPNKTLLWSTSNSSIATVSADGRITAVGHGSATIVVWSEVSPDVRDSVVIRVKEHVESVELEPATASLYEGETLSLDAKVYPSEADDRVLSYSSEDEEIATVDPDGTIHAVSAGTTTVTVTSHDGNKTAQCEITVLCHLEGISFEKSEMVGFINDRIELTPIFYPERTTDSRKLTWESSDDDVAMVNSKGTVVLLSTGNATITATSAENSEIKAELSVTVIAKSDKVTLNRYSAELYEGETITLEATVLPYNDPSLVKWISNNPSAATVSAEGVVTAVSGGTAVIRAQATDNEAHYAECTVIVKSHVTGVSITKKTDAISLGGSYQFEATVSPADAGDKAVTWSSSNPDVISIDKSSGLAKAISSSEAPVTITVTTADGGFPASCEVTVKPYIDKVDILYGGKTVTGGETLILYRGDAIPLQTIVTPEGVNDNVTWTSSKTGVVGIENGKLSIKGVGTAVRLTATTEASKSDGTHATAAVTVNVCNHVETVSLVEKVEMREGETKVLTPTFTPFFTDERISGWESSDKSVATVSSDGTVKAVKSGTAVITVTALDGGKTATCTVIVAEPIIPISSISFSRDSEELEIGLDSYMTNKQVTISPSDASIKELHWEVSDASVVKFVLDDGTLVPTVDTDKSVHYKAVGAGRATVTAKAKDGSSASASLVVNVKSPKQVESIALSATDLTVVEGKSKTISVSVLPDDAKNKGIEWSSSNSSIATVSGTDNSATITGLSKGTTTITAKAKDGSGKTATCTVEVVEEILIDLIQLGKKKITMYVGDVSVLPSITITPSNATNQELEFKASSGVITFSETDRLISAVKKGTTVLTVSSTDGSNRYALLNVEVLNRLVEEIQLPSTAYVKPGGKITLTPTIAPYNATIKNVTWTSSDKTIATVNTSGVVTAVYNGTEPQTVTITCSATDGSGVTATCVVTVANVSTGEDVGFDDWN